MTINRTDIAIVGGGLAGSLIAMRLRQERPDLSVAVIEGGPALGGNHTWSFHETDLPTDAAARLEPFIAHRWADQQVRFPGHQRVLKTGYRSITSESLHAHVAPLLGPGLLSNVKASAITADGVVLGDGRHIAADAVIDARGHRDSRALTLGFQKFVGREIRFARPHGLKTPIIMDGTVPQTDGYRFIYVLPFSEDTALVEDTYYADGADFDRSQIVQEIDSYCRRQGWEPAEVLREEEGVLPIALAGDIDAHLASGPAGVGQAGLGAGLFHPLTGYSLPDAMRLAELIARSRDLSGPALHALTLGYAKRAWEERAFYRMLSRFLFYAAKPDRRFRVLERFYRLPQPLIERFYASVSTKRDKLRVLVGKPPVSFARAMECVDEARWRTRYWTGEGR